MAANPNAALSLFGEALRAPADTPEQVQLLEQLKTLLESEPQSIQTLLTSTLPILTGPSAGYQLKFWTTEILELSLCRNLLRPETKITIAVHALDSLQRLIWEPDIRIHKTAIQCFASAYPLLFRHGCMNPADTSFWGKVTALKEAVLDGWRNGRTATKIAATKCVQQIIQVHQRPPQDPRRAQQTTNLTPNPSITVKMLEGEARALADECVTKLYTSKMPDLMTAIVNSLGTLVRNRPVYADMIIQALMSWTPTLLESATPMQIRGVEKTIHIALFHLLRTGAGGKYGAAITAFLEAQEKRMKAAAAAARLERDEEANRKRQRINDELSISEESKRRRIDGSPIDPGLLGQRPSGPSVFATGAAQTAANPLATFDAKTLPLHLVVELIIANFQVITDDALRAAIGNIRTNIGSAEAYQGFPNVDGAPISADQMQDPLKMELGDEEVPFRPDTIADTEAKLETEDALALEPLPIDIDRVPLELQPPEPVSSKAKARFIRQALDRLSQKGVPERSTYDSRTVSIQDLNALLLARLAARGPDEGREGEEHEDALRESLFAFITADLGSRLEFARLWLNEEWYNEHLRHVESEDTAYAKWLQRLLEYVLQHSQNEDKAFASLILGLPSMPKEEIRRLGDMCLNPQQQKLGFATLYELASVRTPLRREALDALFSLTTHSERTVRIPAINTVKRWVPKSHPLNEMVQEFALRLLRRLESGASRLPSEDAKEQPEVKEGTPDVEMDIEEDKPEGDDKSGSSATVIDGEVVSGLDQPKTDLDVVQHIELLLALCTKQFDLLDEIFNCYPRMESHVQKAISLHITPLIRLLGAQHPKIMSIIQKCPTGSEALVLRILTILTEKGRPPAALVSLIKEMAAERDLSPRFLVPIIAEFNKAEILRNVPRIVSLLNAKPAEKELVRSVFDAVVQTPPQTFGTVSSNVPRVKQTDLLTPVELLALLHQSEKETGIKQAIEAIAICFSMTEIFRSEILAAFMQQIIDEPVLPTLFLRTVIQAVSTYKSLVPYVSTTLLSRLITKKIWQNAQLWEGFIRLARAIAPSSFGALLQLPKEQLRDLVGKQSSLKAPLRDYVVKKAGNNRNRVAGVLEILADEGTPGAGASPSPSQSQSPLPGASPAPIP